MIGNGAVMGFTPREVKDMSLWEFSAVCAGYSRSQGGETPKAPTINKLNEQIAASMARDAAKLGKTDA